MAKCKRRTVMAVVVSENGVYFGYNYCDNEVDVCPRTVRGCATHEGYNLCREVCDQPAHAEVNAINAAGADAKGAELHVFGHDHACDACIKAANDAGIKKITLIEETKVLWVRPL